MAGNSFGKLMRLTTFGESHGSAIGGVIDGFPSGFEVDIDAVQTQLNRRKPGQSAIVTQRKEHDQVLILSGVFDGKTTGAPIGFVINNDDQKSQDYDHLKTVFRPSHADFTYSAKYGHRDYRGGGRSSARETACRVVAGALASQLLGHHGIRITAWVDQVGEIRLSEDTSIDRSQIDLNPVRCPDPKIASQMEELIRSVRKAGDTIGGAIRCEIVGVPAGLGEPVFDKLHADLGKAMLSINAVKGFEYGSGFQGITMRGSVHNDIRQPGGVYKSNNSGGIEGGISNGQDINFRVAFKPVATIMQEQDTVDDAGKSAKTKGKGRHDPCVVPRAVVIVESMAALVILDHLLMHQSVQYNLGK
jgi:chorismate synthase